MRFLKGFCPNMAMVLSTALLIFVYLDSCNPRMGFLYGWPFRVVVFLDFLFVAASSLTLYISWRNEGKDRKKAEEK